MLSRLSFFSCFFAATLTCEAAWLVYQATNEQLFIKQRLFKNEHAHML